MTDDKTPDDEVVSDFDQTNGKAPGLEGDSHGWEDKNNDGILEGDEIDLANPFDAIDGDDDIDDEPDAER